MYMYMYIFFLFYLSWKSVVDLRFKESNNKEVYKVKACFMFIFHPAPHGVVWLLNRVQLAESDPLLGKLLNFAIHTCFLCPRAAQFNQSTSFSKLKNEMGCHCSYSLITNRCLKPDDSELGKERKPRGCSGSIRKGLIRTSVITNK